MGEGGKRGRGEEAKVVAGGVALVYNADILTVQ